MTQFITRRAAIAALAATAGAPALSNAPARSLVPQPRPSGGRSARGAEDIVAEAQLGGTVTFAVYDAATGALLEARGPEVGQPPASVMKALTAAFALDTLGPRHRFETRLLTTGQVSGGQLRGDVILAGGGDPTFSTPQIQDFAAALAGKGISSATGLKTWGGALPYVAKVDPEQADHLGYNPSVSGLNLNFNRVHFSWARSGNGYRVVLDARGGGIEPQVTSARMTVADRRLPVYTYARSGQVDEWTVARRALGNGGSRWLPVRNPEAYAADVMRTVAAGRVALPVGQSLSSAPRGALVTRSVSAPLDEMTRAMLRFSTNITAEALGLSASGARSLAASAEAMGRFGRQKLAMRDPRLVDHSGLNEESRVTARDMAAAMVRMGPRSLVAQLMRDFPMRDANYQVIENHPMTVAAKTGTLNFVSGLAGFARAPSGKEVAFAIFASDLPRRAEAVRRGDEVPGGARSWNRRAKIMQTRLIERWGVEYGSA